MPMRMVKIAIVYHSSDSHTHRIAQAVHCGAASIDAVHSDLITAQAAIERLDELDRADAIIFGCPTYMGGISAAMKAFVDASVVKWAESAWKDKVAGAFTTSGSLSGDNLHTLMGLIVNALQHGMIYVGVTTRAAENELDTLTRADGPGASARNRTGVSLGVAGTSFGLNAPASPGSGDLETAEAYGKRVAKITCRLVGLGEVADH